MRAGGGGGGCTVQQALAAEAAGVVKQAVTLARSRGHAQVTPLHVASTLLSSPTGLLRSACLRSYSDAHPLQCKALELCFNVALNRLPSGSSLLGPAYSPHRHHAAPSISNSLLAAFKRAQAHQRRGSVENHQQPPILAVKIELEQLIISILDDPSVSRVMMEAGFSSTQVKTNVERAVSVDDAENETQPQPATLSRNEEAHRSNNGAAVIRDEDVASVLDGLMKNRRRRKRSTVVVGECVSTMEGVMRAVMDRAEKGDVPEALRGMKFVSLNMGFPCNGHSISREGVERKLGELKSLVMMKSCVVGSEVVVYLGDLVWTTYQANNETSSRNGFCPLRHMVFEIGKLVFGRFGVMGVASFQTYMRCRSGHPSVESLWGLQPLIVPSGSLDLSLIPWESTTQSHDRSRKGGDHEEASTSWATHDANQDCKHHQVTCYTSVCAANFGETRPRTCNSDSNTSSSSLLPAWLQRYKDEQNTFITSNSDEECVPVSDLCRKWNSMCSNSVHGREPAKHNSSERTLTTFSCSPSPSSPTSGFSFEQHNNHYYVWNIPPPETSKQTTLQLYIPEHNKDHSEKEHYCSSSSTPPSASSSGWDAMEAEHAVTNHFKELNEEDLKSLTAGLQKKVPWQRDIVPEIAATVLRCRSGKVMRRKGGIRNRSSSNIPKQDTWLFFQGADTQAKEQVALELARLVFGSEEDFVPITLSHFASTRADSTEESTMLVSNNNKRSRDDQSCSYPGRFLEGVCSNPHRVFFIEDVDQADHFSLRNLKRAAEMGSMQRCDGQEVYLGDAIVILSCESFSSRSRACSPPIKSSSADGATLSDQDEQLHERGVSLDLNMPIYEDGEDVDRTMDNVGLIEFVDGRVVLNINEL